MNSKVFNTSYGDINILNKTQNSDGTSNIEFDLSEQFKTTFCKTVGWDEWSDEKFQKIAQEVLEKVVIDEAVKNNALIF